MRRDPGGIFGRLGPVRGVRDGRGQTLGRATGDPPSRELYRRVLFDGINTPKILSPRAGMLLALARVVGPVATSASNPHAWVSPRLLLRMADDQAQASDEDVALTASAAARGVPGLSLAHPGDPLHYRARRPRHSSTAS